MLKFGIIGLGIMGKNHYRVLKNHPEVTITALCDQYAENIYKEKFYNNADEMLKKNEIDAVIISVPTAFHKEIAIKCIIKGINTFIEKPVATNTPDAIEILKYAKQNKVKTAVGHVERFNPVVISLKNEIKSKDIYSIIIHRVGPIPPRINDVGVLTDLAVHDIDLIRFLTDKKISDKNIFKSQKIHGNHEDNALLSFKLENDIIAGILTNWLTPFKKRTIEVACKEAYYEANLMSQDLKEYSSYQINNSYLVRDCFVKKGEPLYNELDCFINYINTGEKANLATIEDSIITLETLEK